MAALKSLFLIGGAHYTQFVKTLKAISTTKRLLSVPHNSGLLSPKKFCTYMIIHKFKDKIKTFSTVYKEGTKNKRCLLLVPLSRGFLEERNMLATKLVNKIVAGVKFDLDSFTD